MRVQQQGPSTQDKQHSKCRMNQLLNNRMMSEPPCSFSNKRLSSEVLPFNLESAISTQLWSSILLFYKLE